MTLEEARGIALELLANSDWGWGYAPGDEDAILDGRFTPEDLEAIAMVMRADRAAVQSSEVQK